MALIKQALIPHLTVKDAAKAMDFYKKAFGAVERSRFGGPDGKIMHASMTIGDAVFFLNDEFPDWGAVAPETLKGSAVTMTIYTDDADRVFKQAVGAGATVKMEIADQFWGDRYGCVADPSGHVWAIATQKEDLTPEELEKRGREAMAQMAAAPKK
jgi:uncharacterized glyoxalase superfamily protein PhnB